MPVEQVAPMGSFTDPEYSRVGLTQSRAPEDHPVDPAKVSLDSATRPILGGQTRACTSKSAELGKLGIGLENLEESGSRTCPGDRGDRHRGP
jgi:hypothetical protein